MLYSTLLFYAMRARHFAKNNCQYIFVVANLELRIISTKKFCWKQYIVGQPIFFGISTSNSMVKFGQKRARKPIFSKIGSRLTTTGRLRRSSGRSELALPSYLWSLRVLVKRLPNWLKIGVQAGFGPNFTMEFEAEIPKKFGLAYCTVYTCKTSYSKRESCLQF